MTRDVCVVIVHGINTEKPGYSELFQKRVEKALPKKLRQHVDFAEVFWAEHLRDRQRAYIKNAEKADLKYSSWRKLAMQALGDAAAYQKTQWVKNSSYYTVQERVLSKLGELEKQDTDRPVIFVGHSLGCHVISTLAWDVHTIKHMTPEQVAAHDDEEWRRYAGQIVSGSKIKRLDTFAGLITLGNNMPLFTFTFGPERVFPITHTRAGSDATPAFPGPVLPPVLAKGARWVNIYSPNDLLGYPMKCLNEAYQKEERLTDIAEKVEGWLTIAPLNANDAHTKYWTNGRVIKESAKLVREVIEAA